MDQDDLAVICRSIVKAGEEASLAGSDFDIRPATEALYEIVGALKGIDCEIANFKHLVHARLDGIEDRLISLVVAIEEAD
jgi:hypothetical protein